MISAPRRLVLGFAGFVLVMIIAAGTYVWHRISSPLLLDAPRPAVVADLPDVVAKDSASVIEALVTYNLGTAMDSLEAAVPRVYGDIERRLPIASNTRASVGFTVNRSPFRARVVGQTLTLSADVAYQGRVWYRPPLGPELSAGCGVGDDPRPRVRVTIVSKARLTPRWQLRTSTHVLRLEPFSEAPRDRCRLTVLRIDVTDRVIEGTRQMLEDHLAKFDESVSRWPVRGRFVGLWAMLQRPIGLTNGIYLEINPYSAQLGSVGAVGDTVMARVRMLALPRVVSDVWSDYPHPLPPLMLDGDVGSGAHVVLEAAFTYPVASGLLRRALVGRAIKQQGRRIRIEDVQLSGIGGGRVALAVTLTGRVHGRLYFTGTPSLDPAHHQIHVPDLDYDVGTEQELVEGLGWLRGVDIRDFLRERARLPDSAVAGKLRRLAETGINRTLAPGVTLSGRVHDARGTRVRATTHAIELRAVADAEFRLAIDRAPAFPKPPKVAGRAGQ